MITVTVKTKKSTTTANFTNKVAAYRYALHLAEEGCEVEIKEGV